MPPRHGGWLKNIFENLDNIIFEKRVQIDHTLFTPAEPVKDFKTQPVQKLSTLTFKTCWMPIYAKSCYFPFMH
jgi:hypothetical protein